MSCSNSLSFLPYFPCQNPEWKVSFRSVSFHMLPNVMAKILNLFIPTANSTWKPNLDRVRARKGRCPLASFGGILTKWMISTEKTHTSFSCTILTRKMQGWGNKVRIVLGKITFCKKGRRREPFGGEGEGEIDKFTQRANEHNIHTFKSSQNAAKYLFWVCWAIFLLCYHIFCMYIECFFIPKMRTYRWNSNKRHIILNWEIISIANFFIH